MFHKGVVLKLERATGSPWQVMKHEFSQAPSTRDFDLEYSRQSVESAFLKSSSGDPAAVIPPLSWSKSNNGKH